MGSDPPHECLSWVDIVEKLCVGAEMTLDAKQ
jgi:hypothetical protein